MKKLEKIRNIAVALAVVCYFSGAFSMDTSVKAASSFFIATLLFAGSGYFANNLLLHAKRRAWRKKRNARLAYERKFS